ncbi:acyl-CoA desaturase [Dactylosporangium sp. CA-092794]|uniref:acyl-CoA desaturase n=1 Tax=Dactylosporangium sp. CA-092794 TaxID=3239929 RepID=UPI003D9458DF
MAEVAVPTAVDAGDGAAVEGTLSADRQGPWQRLVLAVFIAVPSLAVPAAVWVAWGRGIGWRDVAIAAVFYVVTGYGVTAGFHRYFTHGSFRAGRGLRVALAVAGSMALEGPVVRWVADHRMHHQFSDRDGDPHSPWRYGTSAWAIARGLVWSHVGWLFAPVQAPLRRYVPDLLADRDIVRVSRTFPLWVAVSLLLPAALGGLIGMSWQAALTAFFWGSLVRIGLLHHVTWSVNSICHVFGKQQFASRDRSTNVWWLALPSFGESWHNLHHAEPTSARHGVLRFQLDPSARLIRIWERLGWVWDVRWPDPARIAARRLP